MRRDKKASRGLQEGSKTLQEAILAQLGRLKKAKSVQQKLIENYTIHYLDDFALRSRKIAEDGPR